MKKNAWFSALPVCVLVLGILCASCNTSTDPEPEPEPDTWSPVTSLDQLDGTWKGSYEKTMLVKDAIQLFGETGDDTNSMALLDDKKMKVTITTEATITIKSKDVKEATESGSVTITLAFSDGTIIFAWLMMKPALEASIPNATFDDKNHSVTTIQDIPEQPIDNDEKKQLLGSGLQVSQDGKEIKIPVSKIMEESSEVDISPGLAELIPEEIIMTKQ